MKRRFAIILAAFAAAFGIGVGVNQALDEDLTAAQERNLLAVPTRTYGFESGNCSEFAQGCQAVNGGSTTVVSGDAYAGTRYLQASDNASGGTSYARAVDNLTAVPGEEIWFGAAIRPAVGFYAAANAQARLISWDTYPNTPYMRSGLWVDSTDRVVVYRHVDGGGQTPLVILGTRALPEGVWSFVEIHQVLSTGSNALTEVFVNGSLVGSSTAANMARSDTVARYRVGLADSSSITNPVRVDFDAAYFGPTRQGTVTPPPPPPPEEDPDDAVIAALQAQISVLNSQITSLNSQLAAETLRANNAENRLVQYEAWLSQAP
jgi:hypothetical protein